MRLPFLAVTLLIATPAPAALPPDALAMLKRLPGETLSIDLVLSQAMKSSDSFRAVRAALPATPVAALRSEAALNPQLSLNGGRIIDQNQSLGFSPKSLDSTSATIGLSKYFVTGTRAEASITAGMNEMVFQPAIPGLQTRGFETAAKVVLSQNLLKDAFGSATRAAVDAGSKSSEAAERAFDDSVEQWALDLTNVYYGAWLQQAQVRAAEAGLERQTLLRDMTRTQLKSGTAERPDMLQTEAAVLNAGNGLHEAQQNLAEVWRQLVTSLKLPEAWLSIDPIQIPIALDDPAPALHACGPKGALRPAPGSTAATRRAALEAESAQLLESRARSLRLPTLALQGGLNSNTVTPDGLTFGDTFAVQHPEWSLQLNFAMPFSASAEEADVRQAISTLERSEATASQVAADLTVAWMNACANLHRLSQSVIDLREAAKSQNERVRLERTRLREGRVQTINVVQAGEAATAAELLLNRAEASLRQTAWQVARYEGRLLTHLRGLVEKPVELKSE